MTVEGSSWNDSGLYREKVVTVCPLSAVDRAPSASVGHKHCRSQRYRFCVVVTQYHGMVCTNLQMCKRRSSTEKDERKRKEFVRMPAGKANGRTEKESEAKY